jgi:hypothetical protein
LHVEEIMEGAGHVRHHRRRAAMRHAGQIRSAEEPGLGIGVFPKPVEIGVLPGEVDFAGDHEGREEAGAAMRFAPRIFPKVEVCEEAAECLGVGVLREAGEVVSRLGVEEFERGDTMRSGVDGVVGRLFEEAGPAILERAQRGDPLGTLRRFLGETADGVEDVRRIGAPIRIDAEVSGLFRILPVPAAEGARRDRMVRYDRFGRLDVVAQVDRHGLPWSRMAEALKPGARKLQRKNRRCGPLLRSVEGCHLSRQFQMGQGIGRPVGIM